MSVDPKTTTATVSAARDRVRVDGKFFRLGDRKFHVKGITYGPFAPNANGEMFAAMAPAGALASGSDE